MTPTAELFQRQGYNGTGVKQIVADAWGPFGSLYHFFPGGKEELGAEVIRWSGAQYGQLIDLVFEPAPDVVTAVELFFAGAADTLRETDYADACPIATVALEVASSSEPLREATAHVFESWIEKTAAYFVAAGVPEARGEEVAIALLELLEGPFLLCRAGRSTRPLDGAGATAVAVVRGALR